MDHIKVAAKFAAYTWFRNQPENRGRTEMDANEYAEIHHGRFYDVAYANPGLGRLLVDVIAARQAANQKRSRRARRELQQAESELCGVC